MPFLIRLLISAAGLWVASEIVPGLHVEGTGPLLLAAFLLGVVNAIVRPVAILLTLPLTIVSLGLFLLVVNAAMLGIVAALMKSFTIAGFPSALLGSIVVSITGWVGSTFVGAASDDD